MQVSSNVSSRSKEDSDFVVTVKRVGYPASFAFLLATLAVFGTVRELRKVRVNAHLYTDITERSEIKMGEECPFPLCCAYSCMYCECLVMP